ncbi:PriC [Pantoea ananatis]|uniref:Primosomal replication protein N n=1 Tax=Pantoea ananas TaxID=553 RepID=A0AAJ1CVU7_PANAN|nr:primosomal replication protein [Pantoea ananatis]KTR48396.1 PriC [Pantoea ananatis]KTR57615.1 PriC [Pantoea ananatis]KTR63270.1 PriC [Pantoea ananatis]KTR70437.1 PriC [Pantoea ananatis]MCK0552500.1 primosomal replication protein [Pantoea ananatis]
MSYVSAHQRLLNCMLDLRQDIASHPDGHCRTPRFDSQLFTTKGTRLADYLQEIEHNYQRLCQPNGDVARSQWLASHLVDQIAALQREARTQELRSPQERAQPSSRQRKYQEYREYERRLQAMIDQREQRMALAETLVVQQQLKKDLEVLEGRMARCRQAIRSVEWAMSLANSAFNT